MSGQISAPSAASFPRRNSITFAIAALNEEAMIGIFVREAYATLQRLGCPFEFILVNDGSEDRTGSLMEELAEELENIRAIHNNGNLGLGASYKRGLAEAQGEYYMMLCGDGGYPAESLPPVIERLGAADIIVPNITNLKAIKTPFRYYLSRVYTLLLNGLFGFRVSYYNGLAMHRTALLRRLEIGSQGFGFQAEILVKLLQRGHDFVEVKVLGAEKVHTSKALRLSNIFSVVSTLGSLVYSLLLDRRAVQAGARERLAERPS